MELLALAGVLLAVFVGVNIGGSSTAAAFAPSVGCGMLPRAAAGGLMTVFVLVGGWTVGRNVIHTLSGEIVPSATLTLKAGVIVLLVVGLGILFGNLVGIPASTSETTVGALAGLGVATGTLQWRLVVDIALWWIVSPLIALGVAAAIGRFLYPLLDRRLGAGINSDTRASVIEIDRSGRLPSVGPAGDLTRHRAAIAALTVGVGCYMAFSAGASNVANAVAPLVGEQALSTGEGVLIAAGAIGVGAFTLARRTLETVGNELGELPLVAALVVEVVSATIITALSWLGIPASLAITTTVTIIGLNWGRARRRRLTDPWTIGRPLPYADGSEADDLLDTGTTWRSVGVWVLTPTFAATVAYAVVTLLS